MTGPAESTVNRWTVLQTLGAVPTGTALAGCTGGSDGEPSGGSGDTTRHAYSVRGTFTLCLIFLATFVVLWALNWYLLSTIWQIGPRHR